MLELNRIYNESNLDTMSRMPDGFIDLTVTSPPYDNLRVYKGYSFPFEAIAKELFRVTKQGGVVVWVVGDATVKGSETGTSFKQALFFKEIGFNLHDTMIYAKGNPIPLTHNRYEQQFEYMFILSKGKPVTFNPIKIQTLHSGKVQISRTFYEYNKRRIGNSISKPIASEKIKGNIFYYTVGIENRGKKSSIKHPAIFPENLAEDHILSWSNEGDIVYDCFAGSGTTPKMAEKNGRKWIASEISSEYCEIANERLQQASKVKTLPKWDLFNQTA